MAKRLTDANKWDDPWYLELPANFKLAWDYITSKCDSVGVWKPSKKHIDFHIGMSVDLAQFLKVCGPERIFLMPNGNWWIKKFCDFQYGELKEDSKSPTTVSYIKNLKNHSLWEGYIKGTHRVCNTPKEKEKDKEEEKEKAKEGGPGETKPLTEDWFNYIFDDLFVAEKAMAYREHDVPDQLLKFKSKVRGSPNDYIHRDTASVRSAFDYHLRNTKPVKTFKNGRAANKRSSDAVIEPGREFGSFD